MPVLKEIYLDVREDLLKDMRAGIYVPGVFEASLMYLILKPDTKFDKNGPV
jgi:hypothetical protein